MQTNGQDALQLQASQNRNRVWDAHCGYGDVAGANAQIFCAVVVRLVHCWDVEQRFAHPHVHYVAHATLEELLNSEHLWVRIGRIETAGAVSLA